MGSFGIFLVLIVIICFLLITVIMVQNPKGGGLSSTFGGGGQQLGGVQKTTDFLDKSTWALAILLLVIVLVSNIPIMSSTGSNIEDEILPSQNNIEQIPSLPNSGQDSGGDSL
ncbi:MAG: preprotein translocase subunit SecG [Flavobacteriaceae bacterium]|nr:preprotein translocase subunit SecG [Flavobacteriaceae bacterium]